MYLCLSAIKYIPLETAFVFHHYHVDHSRELGLLLGSQVEGKGERRSHGPAGNQLWDLAKSLDSHGPNVKLTHQKDLQDSL